MLRIAAELGLPVVATNDAHYLKKEDAEAHDVLLAIGTGKDLDDPKRFRFYGQESYVKSEKEMASLFGNRADVLSETARVADLCEFDFEKRYFLPQYPLPAEFATDRDLLVHLARNGAAERYGDPLPRAVEERLVYVLDVVARTLRVEMGDVERLTKLIPSGPAFSVTLAEASDKIPEIKAAAAQDERIRKVLDLGARIEGLARHASVHAAGVVIAPGPLTDYVPVCTAPDSKTDAGAIITQYDMAGIEHVGMLKIDLLGLKTLTVLHDAAKMVAERHGVTIDLERPDLSDPKVYELLRAGRTAGIFQFESPLAPDCLRTMKCDCFDHLLATTDLLRPGPLDTGMYLVFINRKLGRQKVRYPHPALEEILAPTYGVIVYQEQVMRIASALAGYSLAEADVLRKAVGKKIKELIQEELGNFVKRATARGHDKRTIEEIAAQIETFGRYGFNKSHSVAYSILSYQTGWFKTYYPAEFMAALLSSEIGNTDRVVQYINEARELGLQVLPPDVNESGYKFTVIGNERIRFGLGAVRNVGEGAIASIIAGRRDAPYRSLVELCDRIDLRLCNKRVIESLIDAGACDSLGGGGHRAQLVAALDHAFGEAPVRQPGRTPGQPGLFGGDAPGSSP